MTILWSLLYIAVLLISGTAVVLLLGVQIRSLLELVALAMAIGSGVTAILLIWVSIFGFKPSRENILLIGIAMAACAVAGGLARGWPTVKLPALRRPLWGDIAAIVFFMAIAASVLFVGLIATRFDFFEGDTVAIWGFKAKVLFYEPLSPKPFVFTDPGYSFSHQDYPLLMPMLVAAAYAMLGSPNETAGKIAIPLLYAAQAVLAYSATRRWLSPSRALCATALLVCMPVAIFMAGTGHPDAILETFYLGALIYLVRWVEEGTRYDLMLSSIFCTLGAMTKQEGLPLALIELVVLIAFIVLSRNHWRSWQDLLLFTAILAIGAGSWWVWRTGLPHTTDNYDARFHLSIVLQNFWRVRNVLRDLGLVMITWPLWGGLWVLLPVFTAIGFRALKTSTAKVLWSLLVLHIVLYIVAYVVSTWDVDRLLDVTRVRLMLHVAPAAMLLIALHWSRGGARAME